MCRTCPGRFNDADCMPLLLRTRLPRALETCICRYCAILPVGYLAFCTPAFMPCYRLLPLRCGVGFGCYLPDAVLYLRVFNGRLRVPLRSAFHLISVPYAICLFAAFFARSYLPTTGLQFALPGSFSPGHPVTYLLPHAFHTHRLPGRYCLFTCPIVRFGEPLPFTTARGYSPVPTPLRPRVLYAAFSRLRTRSAATPVALFSAVLDGFSRQRRRSLPAYHFEHRFMPLVPT